LSLNVLTPYNTAFLTYLPILFSASSTLTAGFLCITSVGLPLTANKLCCRILAVVHTLPIAVNADETVIVPSPFLNTVRVSAVLLFTATNLALNTAALAADKATHVVVVVAGALIKAARLALVASTSAPSNTLPGVVPIEATKVNVTP